MITEVPRISSMYETHFDNDNYNGRNSNNFNLISNKKKRINPDALHDLLFFFIYLFVYLFIMKRSFYVSIISHI